MRFTQRSVDKFAAPAAGKGPIDYFDDVLANLCLTVRPSGSRSWCVRYRINGAQKRLTLGAWPGLTVDAARRATREALGAIALGRDPAKEKQQRRHVELLDDAFPKMARRFVIQHCRQKNKSWRAQARLLGLQLHQISARRLRNPQTGDPEPVFNTIPGGFVDRWAKKRVQDITRADAALAVQELVGKGDRTRNGGRAGGPIAACSALATLQSMFSWLASQGILERSTIESIPAPALKTKRKRVLSDEEIKVFWQATAALAPPHRSFLRVLLLTAQRRSEVSDMRWDEIAGDLWTLPEERSKNKHSHAVPLSSLVVAELQANPRKPGGYVFTTRDDGKRPIGAFNDIKAQLDTAMRAIAGPIEPWVLHDLRRSATTGMAAIEIKPVVLEAVLNHRSGIVSGVAEVYNKHPYLPEKRDALLRWSDHIAKVTGHQIQSPAENVIAFA